jgi:hypothetical protein
MFCRIKQEQCAIAAAVKLDSDQAAAAEKLRFQNAMTESRNALVNEKREVDDKMKKKQLTDECNNFRKMKVRIYF